MEFLEVLITVTIVVFFFGSIFTIFGYLFNLEYKGRISGLTLIAIMTPVVILWVTIGVLALQAGTS